MNIICHRINTIEQLKKTPTRFGIEIDIRSYDKELILHHDPFIMAESFKNWLSYYKHQTLILNIKEEGLEDAILDLISAHQIQDYFFLDLSFPFLVKKSNQGLTKIAARLSEFESIETVLALKNRIEWVWIDCFTHYPLTPDVYQKLKSTHLKLCLVSPELVRGDKNEIREVISFLKNNSYSIDAVCTKHPQIWEESLLS